MPPTASPHPVRKLLRSAVGTAGGLAALLAPGSVPGAEGPEIRWAEAAWSGPVETYQYRAAAGWESLGPAPAGAGWAYRMPAGEWVWTGQWDSAAGVWVRGAWTAVIPVEATPGPDFREVGLLAHYRLDGDAVDRLGRASPGTVTGALPSADRFGRAGRALGCDTGTAVTLPYKKAIAYGGGDFTVGLWFRTEPGASVAGSTLLSTETFIGGRNGLILWFVTGDAATVQNTLAAELWRLDKNAFVLNNGPLNDGQWHHSVVVRDGPKVWLYLDANCVGMNEILPLVDPINLSDPILLANGHSFFTPTFVGALDDLRLYGRALSADEIAALHQDPAD